MPGLGYRCRAAALPRAWRLSRPTCASPRRSVRPRLRGGAYIRRRGSDQRGQERSRRMRARPPKTWCLCRGGEEVDEQLVDAFSLVVMHPMRCVGQAFHAVEVGHVVGRARRGRSRGRSSRSPQITRVSAPKSGEALLRLPSGTVYRGAVVVDHPGRRPWLRPRLDVAFDFACRAGSRPPGSVGRSASLGVHHVLGQFRVLQRRRSTRT